MISNKKRWQMMAATMLLALCSGIGYTWSVFQGPLMEGNGWALDKVSLTFTIQVLVSTIAPVFLGRFQKTLGVRKYIRIGLAVYVLGIFSMVFTNSVGYLYIIYGIIVGIGIAMLFPCLMAYSTSLFPEKTGMASGLLACSYGSGAVLWAPIATLIMQNNNVNHVFGYLAVIFAAVMIPATFFISDVTPDMLPKSEKENDEKTAKAAVKDMTWKEMLKTSRYYILVIALTIGATAGLMIVGHASSMIQEVVKVSAEKAALLVGLFSVFNALGRLMFGFVSDKLGRYNVMMILFAVICAAMIVLSNTSSVAFIIALLAISSCYGGFTSLFSPVCADNFGIKNLAVNYTFLYVAYGLAGAVGPQLAARIKTASGGYNAAFVTVAVMCVVGIALVLILKLIKKKEVLNKSNC